MCIGKRLVGIAWLVVLMMVSMGVENLYAQPNISAELKAIPETYSGPCPVRIRFEGRITVTNITRPPSPIEKIMNITSPPLEVQYRFIRSDGALGPVETLRFERDGSRPVRTTWDLGGSGEWWQAIKVIHPQDVESNKANFKIECKGVPPGEGAGLPGEKCCIAGTYDGTNVDDPKCPAAERDPGKFILVINQEPGCGSKIWGEVIDPEDNMVTAKLEGTITPGPGRCCTLKGIAREVGGKKCEHRIKAILCRGRDGKWYTNNGVYHALTPGCCNGTFKMKQR